MLSTDNQEIRSKILLAAEAMFARHGYESASLRKITQAAKVNLAAVNYHFSDKQSLYCEIVTRRLRKLNEIRLARLKDAEQRAGDAPMALREIVEALVAPVFELGQDTTQGGQNAVRIIGRSLTEPQPFMTSLLAAEFQPVMVRFAQALRRQISNLPPEDFLWRLSFVIGAMHHTLATIHQMKDLTSGICRSDDYTGALGHFLDFAVSTLAKPANSTARD